MDSEFLLKFKMGSESLMKFKMGSELNEIQNGF